METKGERIYKARKKAGFTLEELGNQVGVSKATIKRYEIGTISNIPSDKIELIAKATGVTESYIMGWEDDTNSLTEQNYSSDTLEMIQKYNRLIPINKDFVKNTIDMLLEKQK